MSAILNFNEIAYIAWKGPPTKQITPFFQMNQNKTILSKYNLKLAQPLKIFRKEIASTALTTCTPRYIKIDEIMRPNGYMISKALPQHQYGISEIIDLELPNNSTERPGSCNALSTNGVCLNPAQNALKRCRSSGMIKRNFNTTHNNDTYYTSTKQYLESRNLLFSQNQYNYLKSGNNAADPGSSASQNNQYYAGGISHCLNGTSVPVYYKPNNAQYAKQGGVSSGDKITRLKYNTITSNAMKFRNAFGSATGNALAYSTTGTVYTIKDKLGFPDKKTPVFNKYSAVQTCCTLPSPL